MTASRWGYNVHSHRRSMNEHLIPVIYTYNGSRPQPVNAGVYTAVVRYDGSANYEAVSRTYTLTIFKARPSLQWGIPPALTYGAGSARAQLNATRRARHLQYSPPAGTILNAGTHPLDARRSCRPTRRTIEIVSDYSLCHRRQGVPAGRVGASRGHRLRHAARAPTQLNATANVAGNVRVLPPRGRCSGGRADALESPFTPNDLANYYTGDCRQSR